MSFVLFIISYTARMISKYRPDAHIIVQTPDLRATREMSLVWGVTACYRPELWHMGKFTLKS